LRKEQLFLSHLVADNEYFQKHLSGKNVDRRYDVLFSGRIVSKKNPIFFAEVCGRVKERLGKCSVLILGEGEESLKAQMREIFEKQGVTYHFAGFIQHEALPNYYAQAKVLLLPTSGDCWGVVINEAMLAGTPVITTEWTAAAGELVLDGTNGFVLPLESRLWADKIEALLNDPEKLAAFSECAKRTVAPFCFENAAHGILASIHYLEKREHSFVDRAQLKGRHQTV
jgi:glycosyltransferase involved in cell wall biosynthesis